MALFFSTHCPRTALANRIAKEPGSHPRWTRWLRRHGSRFLVREVSLASGGCCSGWCKNLGMMKNGAIPRMLQGGGRASCLDCQVAFNFGYLNDLWGGRFAINALKVQGPSPFPLLLKDDTSNYCIYRHVVATRLPDFLRGPACCSLAMAGRSFCTKLGMTKMASQFHHANAQPLKDKRRRETRRTASSRASHPIPDRPSFHFHLNHLPSYIRDMSLK